MRRLGWAIIAIVSVLSQNERIWPYRDKRKAMKILINKSLSMGQDIPKTLELKTVINGVHYDQKKGAGASKDSDELLYKGFVAYMKASAFLSLCDMNGASEGDKTTKGFIHYIHKGGIIASPCLTYDIDGNEIVAHDGRHRTMAIEAAIGDVIIRVQIKLNKGILGKEVNKDLVESFNYYCKSENGKGVSDSIIAYYSENDKFQSLQG